MINLGIIEDNRRIGEALKDYFSKEEEFEVLFCANSFRAIPTNKIPKLDLVLCDIGLPGKSGLEITWLLKQKKRDLQIVVFTVFDDNEKIFQALKAGASGYLLKSTPLHKIKKGLFEVMQGGAVISPIVARKVTDYFRKKRKKTTDNLTQRESEVLELIKTGHTNKQTADSIGVSVDTVKFHVKNIYKKLGIKRRSELYGFFLNTTEHSGSHYL